MTPYDFEVLKDGVVIDIQSIHLPHIRFAWPEIVRLAKRFCGPGHKIRVKDDAGGIVILTGVDAVRRHTRNEDVSTGETGGGREYRPGLEVYLGPFRGVGLDFVIVCLAERGAKGL